jgi:urease beta subunit
MIPGELIPKEGTIELNEGRPVTELNVANTGDRPIQIGSHFHFFEVNAALQSIGPLHGVNGWIFQRERQFGLNPEMRK